MKAQPKGRIERLFGTFQDRLVAELRMARAETIEQAQRVLASFLPRFNEQIGVPARQPGSAYRPLEEGKELAAICCFKYVRTVARDNTVKLGEHRLQLKPGPGRMSYGRARVEIHEQLDGSLHVWYHGHCVATQEAPLEAPILRARPSGWNTPTRDVAPVVDPPVRPAYRRPPDHPWNRSYKSMIDRGRVTESKTA